MGYLITNRWLELANRPTAIFGGNNFMSMGALLALRERGLRVPEDVAVVSFDDVEFGYLLRPALTALEYSWQKIGETAARLMLDKISRKDVDFPSRRIILPFKFAAAPIGMHREQPLDSILFLRPRQRDSLFGVGNGSPSESIIAAASLHLGLNLLAPGILRSLVAVKTISKPKPAAFVPEDFYRGHFVNDFGIFPDLIVM
ncbi:MAG: substrate-binding domain-containing protein [Anaerolineae bacterium]